MAEHVTVIWHACDSRLASGPAVVVEAARRLAVGKAVEVALGPLSPGGVVGVGELAYKATSASTPMIWFFVM